MIKDSEMMFQLFYHPGIAIVLYYEDGVQNNDNIHR